MTERAELKYWVWLTMAFGPANPRKWSALSHYRSVEEAYESISHGDMTWLFPRDFQSVKSASMTAAEKMIEFCGGKKIKLCAFDDPIFPQRFKDINNPPSLLFYIGDISGIDAAPIITAVGTRSPSEYSVEISKRICGELADAGFDIASGFAVGLDSVAHTAALTHGAKTYAVLPCGLLYGYPAENRNAKAVIAKHGAVISEYFPSEKASSTNFKARNRLLSAISLGTLVLQSSRNGGPLSTASFAVSQGKDIFCIPPHELYDDEYGGASELLREGVIPVFDGSDIINEYKGKYPNRLRSEEIKAKIAAAEADIRPKPMPKPKTSQKEKEKAEESAPLIPPPSDLSGAKKDIYDFIRERGEVHLDMLEVGIGDVLELDALLTELELDGLIRSLPGNRFSV